MMEDLIYQMHGVFCHQDHSRTLWVNGTDIGICFRCFGLHIGFALTWFLWAMVAPSRKHCSLRGTYGLFIAPVLLAVHWVMGAFYGYTPDPGERLMVGLFAGPSLAVLAHIYTSGNAEISIRMKLKTRRLIAAVSLLVIAVMWLTLSSEVAVSMYAVTAVATSFYAGGVTVWSAVKN